MFMSILKVQVHTCIMDTVYTHTHTNWVRHSLAVYVITHKEELENLVTT